MRTTVRILTVLVLVGAGYLLGSLQLLHPQKVQAQPADMDTPEQKIKSAYKTLKEAQDMLVQRGRYKGAINGVNTFAVTSGGVDAISDLNQGTGVDPETFAGLYAGQANDEVAGKLKMVKGRLTYNKKVVKMYSIDRLKKLYRKRAGIAGLKTIGPSLTPLKKKPNAGKN